MSQSELFDSVFFDSQQQRTMKVDIVYTFVDTSDKAWRIKYEKFNKKFDTGRYDQSHIIFSLQTINKYFVSQNINNIYIVSDYQRLDLNKKDLDKIYNKIIYIDHDDIIPKKFLPTFNSMVIEAFLWNIPNVLDNFLYFNDDVFLAKYLTIKDLFINDKTIQFFHHLSQQSHPWYKNILSSNKLFEERIGRNMKLCPQHAIYNIVTKELKNTYNIFEKDLQDMFLYHKTRRYDNKAHNLIFLYGMYAHYKNIAINKKASFSHIFNFKKSFVDKTKDIKNREQIYAISSNIKEDQQQNFYEFKQNVLN